LVLGFWFFVLCSLFFVLGIKKRQIGQKNGKNNLKWAELLLLVGFFGGAANLRMQGLCVCLDILFGFLLRKSP
jgi:hypothetical protein